MSDYIKYMYREYLEGRTRIKKVNEDQPLFPNTDADLLIQKKQAYRRLDRAERLRRAL